MSLRARASFVAVLLAALVAASCSGKPGSFFGKQYEYEEDLFVSLDGSATLVVNASIPALVALRGLDFDVNPSVRVDRDQVREAYTSPVASVTRVSQPWRRAGRRFVQIRLEVSDIRRLHEAKPFAWSRYDMKTEGDLVIFHQRVGPSALKRGALKKVGWNGQELVAFRLHLPSKIRWHNARDLETNEASDIERGNILRWEQHLADRLDGVPVELEVRMDQSSILYRTLWLFAGAFLAAVALIAALIWWTMRKAPKEVSPQP
jgi:hypothetical protein